MPVDPGLIHQYAQMHETGHFQGLSLLPHVKRIAQLVEEYKPDSLLDYGCGKGQQYFVKRAHDAWGIMPRLYDPAVSDIRAKPQGVYGGVICTDVLEHVPEEHVESTLAEIFDFASDFIFLSICTRAAKKTLPDGRNVHLTIRPAAWWMEKINTAKANAPRHVHVEVAWHDD